jgi:hypothetical protein
VESERSEACNGQPELKLNKEQNAYSPKQLM